MAVPGVFEILILLLLAGAILSVLFRLFGGRSESQNRGGFSLGHATLACPNCGQETRAGVPTCEHCGRDL